MNKYEKTLNIGVTNMIILRMVNSSRNKQYHVRAFIAVPKYYKPFVHETDLPFFNRYTNRKLLIFDELYYEMSVSFYCSFTELKQWYYRAKRNETTPLIRASVHIINKLGEEIEGFNLVPGPVRGV